MGQNKTTLFLTLLIFISGSFSACSSHQPADTILNDPSLAMASNSPAIHTPPIPLAPKGILLYTGNGAPILKYVAPNRPAAKAGLLAQDEILEFNGQRIFTAAEFENKLHFAPRESTLTYRRNRQRKLITVILDDERPRMGAFFEPLSTPLVKLSAPYIAFMHVNDVTVFAETSINERKKELHLNLIMQSMKPIPLAQMSYTITEKGKTTPLARGFENIDALGSDSQIFSKIFREASKPTGPIQVSVNIDKNHFHFEFQ